MSLTRAAFSTYRAEVARRSPLSAEVERDLAIRHRSGDKEAGRRLVEACLPFVMTIAIEYRRWGIPLEDIVQEGNVGLLKAAARFDPDRGCRLSTYAAYWIRAEIREHLVRAYRIVRLGTSKSERRALRAFRRTRERDPELLAQASGMSPARVEELLPILSQREMSLDQPTSSGSLPLEHLASGARTPEEEAGAREQRAKVAKAYRTLSAQLSPRERCIVRRRWLAEEPATLERLGAAFGVSKERVRQIEERTRTRLREQLEQLALAG